MVQGSKDHVIPGYNDSVIARRPVCDVVTHRHFGGLAIPAFHERAGANLEAVATEVERAEAAASLSAMTFACELESLAAGAARNRLLYLASKVGLSADATRMVLDEYELRAKLLHEAHLVLRNLINAAGGSAGGRNERIASA